MPKLERLCIKRVTATTPPKIVVTSKWVLGLNTSAPRFWCLSQQFSKVCSSSPTSPPIWLRQAPIPRETSPQRFSRLCPSPIRSHLPTPFLASPSNRSRLPSTVSLPGPWSCTSRLSEKKLFWSPKQKPLSIMAATRPVSLRRCARPWTASQFKILRAKLATRR